jgi:hypothetical protein
MSLMQGTRRRERLEGYALLPKVKLVESEWDLAHNSNIANWESEITQNGSRSGLPWAARCFNASLVAGLASVM